jgi:hypothetical protein
MFDAIKENVMNGAHGGPVEKKIVNILLVRKPKRKTHLLDLRLRRYNIEMDLKK